jgi:acyl-CoA synthetase (AMP-forming)/AMP-acid ligase II
MVLPHAGARLIDATDGATVSGDALQTSIDHSRAALDRAVPGVVFVLMSTSVAAVVTLLAALRGRRPVVPLDPGLPPRILTEFMARFEPGLVTGLDGTEGETPVGYQRRLDPDIGAVWERLRPSDFGYDRDLAVLLTTSGSTGDPKLVRLSGAGFEANIRSVVRALDLGSTDVAVTALPLHYSYGLSVLATHLSVGATVVLEPRSLVHRPFWESVDRFGVTSLSLVPAQYQMLDRLRFDPTAHPTLTTLTQAGGRLSAGAVIDFHRRMASVGGRLFVMYGQTEAGPRITTLPADRVAEKVGSVGPALAGGSLSIRLADGSETTRPDVVGEVMYRGPNVMLGYAERAGDLCLGDVNHGVLETGDLGHLDAEGYLYLDGRTRRIAKVFGVRLNLDDVERLLSDVGPAAAVGADDRVRIWVERAGEADLDACRATLAEQLRLHWSGFELRSIEALPLLPSGKVDYRSLEASP